MQKPPNKMRKSPPDKDYSWSFLGNRRFGFDLEQAAVERLMSSGLVSRVDVDEPEGGKKRRGEPRASSMVGSLQKMWFRVSQNNLRWYLQQPGIFGILPGSCPKPWADTP